MADRTKLPSEESKLLSDFKSSIRRNAVHFAEHYGSDSGSENTELPFDKNIVYLNKFTGDVVGRPVELKHIFRHIDIAEPCYHVTTHGGKNFRILANFTRDILNGNLSEVNGTDNVIHVINSGYYKETDEIMLADFLFGNMIEKLEESTKREGLKYMMQYSSKIIFVLDFLHYDVYDAKSGFSFNSPATSSTILLNLFTNKIFPFCRIISSSYHTELRKSCTSLFADRILILSEVTPEAIENYIIDIVGERDARDLMIRVRKTNPDCLISIEYLYLQDFVILAFSRKFDPLAYIPKTTPGILLIGLQMFINPDAKDAPRNMHKLQILAYNATQTGRMWFNKKDFTSVGLSVNVIDMKVPISKNKTLHLFTKHPKKSVWSFTYYEIQELLCALHIANMKISYFIQFFSKFFHRPLYFGVRKMLCGVLLDFSVYEQAAKLGIEASVKEAAVVKRKNLLLANTLKDMICSSTLPADKLNMFSALREASDAISYILPCEKRVDIQKWPLTPQNMHGIASILRCQKEVGELNMKDCVLSPCSLNSLYKAVVDRKSSIKIKVLNASVSKYIEKEGISAGSYQRSSSSTDLNFRRIKELKSSWNQSFSIEGVQLLANIVRSCSVEKLDLSNRYFTPEEVKVFKETLGETKLKIMVLSAEFRYANQSGIDLIVHLLEIVSEVLQISGWDVSSQGKKIFQTKLNDLNIEGLKLVLDNNEFLTRQIIWEKTQEQNINPEGEVIDLNDSTLSFPTNSFKGSSKVRINIKSQCSNYPENYIVLTSVLQVTSEKQLEKPAIVRLKLIGTGDNSRLSKRLNAHLFHLEEDDNEWKMIDTFPLSNDPSIEFQCHHFSSIFVAIKELVFGPLLIPITGFVLAKDDVNWLLTFCFDNKMIKGELEKDYEAIGYKKLIPSFNTVLSRVSDKLFVNIKIIQPKIGFSFFPSPDEFSVVINKNLIKFQPRLDFKFLLRTPAFGSKFGLVFKYEVMKNNDICETGSFQQSLYFKRDLKINSEESEEQLEDVFQRDIIPRFVSTTEFKKFARDSRGLGLREDRITSISEDLRHSVDEQKMKMLMTWKQFNGSKATARHISDIVDDYFSDDVFGDEPPATLKPILNEVVLLNMEFDKALEKFTTNDEWKDFALSQHGLRLSDRVFSKIVRKRTIITEIDKKQMLEEWEKANGVEATAWNFNSLLEKYLNSIRKKTGEAM